MTKRKVKCRPTEAEAIYYNGTMSAGAEIVNFLTPLGFSAGVYGSADEPWLSIFSEHVPPNSWLILTNGKNPSFGPGLRVLSDEDFNLYYEEAP